MNSPLAPEHEPLGGTAVYRLFDADNRLLYVGITNTLRLRLLSHSKEKDWWASAVRRTVVWHEERAAAEAEESLALLTENPAHNYAGPPSRTPPRRVVIDGASHCSVVQARRSLGELVEAAYYLGRPTVVERHGVPYAAVVPERWLAELVRYRARFGPLVEE